MCDEDGQDYEGRYRQYIKENWLPVMDSRAYTCGFCGREVSSHIGLQRHDRWVTADSLSSGALNERLIEVRTCPQCWAATTFGAKEQYPKPLLGDSFDARDKSDDVKLIVALYNDARTALSQGASSCAVLMFRKLLMHIAVEQGAMPGQKFIKYVEYLKDEAVVGRPMHPLVQRIRDDGNEENHQIVRATREKAEGILMLVTLLIRSVYFAQ